VSFPISFTAYLADLLLENCFSKTYLVHLQFPFGPIDDVPCVEEAILIQKTIGDTVWAFTSEWVPAYSIISLIISSGKVKCCVQVESAAVEQVAILCTRDSVKHTLWLIRLWPRSQPAPVKSTAPGPSYPWKDLCLFLLPASCTKETSRPLFICKRAVAFKCTCRCKCMHAQNHTSLPVLHCLGRSGHCLAWHQRQEAQGCPLRWHLWGCLRRTWLSNCRHQT